MAQSEMSLYNVFTEYCENLLIIIEDKSKVRIWKKGEIC